MGDVVKFPKPDGEDRDPDELLKELVGKLDGFVLVGYGKDLESEVVCCTFSDAAEAHWLLHRGAAFLLETA